MSEDLLPRNKADAQDQTTKPANRPESPRLECVPPFVAFGLRSSVFGFPSDFGCRISDLGAHLPRNRQGMPTSPDDQARRPAYALGTMALVCLGRLSQPLMCCRVRIQTRIPAGGTPYRAT